MDADTLKSRFGQRVREIRKQEGFTQAELAEAAKLSVEYIGKIERGLASPSFSVISRLAESLGKSPAEFFR